MMTTAVASRHRAWIDIDHTALVANLAALRRLAGAAQVIAVVKANAYGHGAVEVARTLVEHGAERLGVATLSEAMELRSSGLAGPMVLLWGIGAGDAEAVAATRVEPIVDNAAELGWLESAGAAAGLLAEQRIGSAGVLATDVARLLPEAIALLRGREAKR